MDDNLLGSGIKSTQVSNYNKYKDIIQMQIGFEFMKKAAAYRTFNIILSESREVGLLLYFN